MASRWPSTCLGSTFSFKIIVAQLAVSNIQIRAPMSSPAISCCCYEFNGSHCTFNSCFWRLMLLLQGFNNRIAKGIATPGWQASINSLKGGCSTNGNGSIDSVTMFNTSSGSSLSVIEVQLPLGFDHDSFTCFIVVMMERVVSVLERQLNH